jgi:hypothetical protein
MLNGTFYLHTFPVKMILMEKYTILWKENSFIPNMGHNNYNMKSALK